ncbi:MAG: hypothetical protein QOG85_107 [Gaiellaceae bacterium]|jgi:hypothetical protein|nr:hypothetical protein [Gaiellaceae bacterium]
MRAFGVLAVTALVLAGCGGGSGGSAPTSPGGGPTLGNDPVLMSAAQLEAEAKFLGQPIYWAGPKKGYVYEFQHTSAGYVYVRYLPRGIPVGDPGTHLTVATYPFKGAVKGVKGASKGKWTKGPDGSVLYVRNDHPGSVLMAFPGVPYEIEVYDPRPASSAFIAQSGDVRPVG